MRLDAALVKRGMVETRSEASRMIEAGNVTVGGVFAEKASRLVAPDEAIEIVVAKRYVSRGGEKMEHALEHFHIDVVGRSVLDAGVSTGGFTDCVLQKGARRVFAVDVGRNQLHEKIKSDARVVWKDGVNVRDMKQGDVEFSCSLVVADLSFISLTKVLDALMSVVSTEDGFAETEMVLLVKPQFESGRIEVSRGKGIITDPVLHEKACSDVADHVRSVGGTVLGVVVSPILGAQGNTEFLMHVKCPTHSVGYEA